MGAKLFFAGFFLHGVSLCAATWIATGDGNWNDGANWSGGNIPNAMDAVAAFGNTATPIIVTLNVNATVGTITFDSTGSYTISGGNTLTFDVTAMDGNGAITIGNQNGNGSHTISSAPITLDKSLVITQNSTGVFTLSSDISGAHSVTKAGAQTLVLSGTNGYSGGTILSAGTLSIVSDANLGNAAGPLTIDSAILTATGGVTSSRAVTLTGGAIIDTGANTVTFSGGVTGPSGSLTKQGSGTLVLTNASNYAGGTTVNAGTLQGNTDSLQGNIANSGVVEFNQSAGGTYAGVISGSGSLEKTGAAALILTGANSYSGGTTVTAGTLQGNTNSLQGNISNSAAVVFDQASNGTYSGVLSGAGTLTKQGSGVLQMTADSSGFTGATSIVAGNLQVTGSLAGSAIALGSATLSGTGTVGSVVSTGGTLQPGTSIGTLTIQGNLTLDVGSTTVIEAAPTSTSLVQVTGVAMLDGALSIVPQPGFYGLEVSHTILTAADLMGTTFASVSTTNANFIASVMYLPTSVLLTLQSQQLFFDFPFGNANEASVGANLNAIAAAGTLNADLIAVINSLVGESFDAINDALDQMHPAQVSAFAQLQSAVGAQVLSLCHRKARLGCGCSKDSVFWMQPFGNWLVQKETGMQIGFRAHTWGIAAGIDTEVSDGLSLGIEGVYNRSDLNWHSHRGRGDVQGVYGGVYTDFTADNYFVGSSILAGIDWYDINRHIQFSTIDRNAISNTDAFDLMAQLSAAYFFGYSGCHLAPFANCDVFYLRMNSFVERDADSLNLSVQPYGSLTVRAEAGVSLEVVDKNYGETICISPLVALGWAMDCPIARDPFTATLQDQTIPFETTGWEKTWQLLTARFGLSFYVHCFTLSGEYVGEFSTDKKSSYENQRANVRLSFQW